MLLEAKRGHGDHRGVRRPDAEPQQDVGDGDLGDLDLGTLLLVPSRPQALNIHLLGLSFESLLVGDHRLDDGDIKAADHGERGEVVDDVGKHDEGFRIPILNNENE